MAKYESDRDFSGFQGQGKPRNPKGVFVVPTGSASMINVSSSIKGGTVGSTKDTFNLLSGLDDGGEYTEPWHEAVHYLDKRVNEVSNGLNAVADSNNNQSGSSGKIGAANRVEVLKLITNSGSFSTRATANDAKTGTTSTERTRIAANHAKVSMVIGTRSTEAKAGNTTTISTAQANAIAAGATISNKTEGSLVLSISDNKLVITSVVGRTTRNYIIEPQG